MSRFRTGVGVIETLLLLIILGLVVGILFTALGPSNEAECLASGKTWTVTGKDYIVVTTYVNGVPLSTFQPVDTYSCVAQPDTLKPGVTP